MTLWLGIVVLTFGAAALALRPLFRARQSQTNLDLAIRFYETRRAELQRQVDAGLISDAERDASEAEQARRLLTIERQSGDGGSDDPAAQRKRRKMAALLLLVGLPLLSVPLYLKIGRPGVPDQPLTARVSEPRNLQLAEALQKIEAHLQKNPNDARGFEVVAPVYMQAGRFDDAAFAYRRIIAISGENPQRLADLGEAIAAGQNGIVNAEAKAAFLRAVELDPGFAKAQFYIALATEQDGDIAGAVKKLLDLSAALPDGPGKMRVETELDRFRAEGKAPPRAAASGPSGEEGQTIAGLPPEERAKAIEGMVESLSERLRTSGGTLNDWQRLIQARMVLDQREKAAEALSLSRKALSADTAAIAALDLLAERLGLSGEGTKP